MAEPQKVVLSGPSEEFLARNEKYKNQGPTITDVNQFRKRYKLEPTSKIFIVVGGYGTLKKAFLERGWFENPDRHSPVFDLKFAIKQSETCTQELQDHQIVNHFLKNNLITTKTGLTSSLKYLIWWNTVDMDTFYPKCFDLTDNMETEDFKNEYRFIKAESIVKIFKKEKTIKHFERLQVALNVCWKRMKDVDDQLDDPKLELTVTDKEWEVIAKQNLTAEFISQLYTQKWFMRLHA